jgi:DNA-binding GntR family transcriptional regulator
MKMQDKIKKEGTGAARDKELGQPLVLEAYKKIKHLIFQQRLAPGQRLVYKDLCTMLNMSRTPIINALNRLEQERFVASESFRGFYVRPMDIQEAWDAFGVREALETYAVEQAIIQGDEKGMAGLEEKLFAHEQYKTNIYDQKKFLFDAEFHIQIARMSKNNVIRWLLKSNLEHVYLRSRLEGLDPARMSVAVEGHQKLIDKMKKKDIMGSIEIIKNHIHGSRDLIIKCLSKNALEEEDYDYL